MAKTKRARKRLVLDLGASAVRVCELTQTRTGLQLTRYVQREFIADPSLDEAQRRQIQLDALREALRDSKIRHKKAILAVPGQSVFARTRVLPPVNEFKVPQIVRYEIQQQIPFSLNQIALDYQVLSRTDGGGYDVLMTAIKVDVVEKRLELLRAIKRSIDTVDVAPFAAYNWLKAAGQFGTEGECVAMVDIGAATTDIIIENGGQFRYPRSVSIGGNDVTSAIASSMNITFAEAERVKRERAFAPTGDAQKDGQAGEIVGRILNRLANEITKSFAYFRAQPGGAPVSRVVLTGGGASLRNIVPFLQRTLGVEVRIAQPLAGLAVAPGAQAVNDSPEQAAVALGLALRAAGAPAIELNLIPPRILEAARRREQVFYWGATAVVLLLTLGAYVPIAAQNDRLVQENTRQLKEVLAKYDPAVVDNPQQQSQYERELQFAKSIVDRYKGQVDAMDAARQGRTFWIDRLQELNQARPDDGDIWFSSVESTTIGGKRSKDDIAQFQPGMAGRSLGGAAGGIRGGRRLDEEEEEMMMGGGMGMMGMGSYGAVNEQQLRDTTDYSTLPYFNTGFTGLVPTLAGQQSAYGGMGGGMAGGIGAGFGAAAQQPNPEDIESLPPIKPNGLTIRGYVLNPETITEFRRNLETSGAYIDGGVYFEASSANKQDWTVLYQAAVAGSPAGMGARAGMGAGMYGGIDDEDDRYERRRGGGGYGGGIGGGLGGGRTGGGVISFQRQGNSVTSFQIDVQFDGAKVEIVEGPVTGPGAPGAGFGTGMDGLFSRGESRRDEF